MKLTFIISFILLGCWHQCKADISILKLERRDHGHATKKPKLTRFNVIPNAPGVALDQIDDAMPNGPKKYSKQIKMLKELAKEKIRKKLFGENQKPDPVLDEIKKALNKKLEKNNVKHNKLKKNNKIKTNSKTKNFSNGARRLHEENLSNDCYGQGDQLARCVYREDCANGNEILLNSTFCERNSYDIVCCLFSALGIVTDHGSNNHPGIMNNLNLNFEIPVEDTSTNDDDSTQVMHIETEKENLNVINSLLKLAGLDKPVPDDDYEDEADLEYGLMYQF